MKVGCGSRSDWKRIRPVSGLPPTVNAAPRSGTNQTVSASVATMPILGGPTASLMPLSALLPM